MPMPLEYLPLYSRAASLLKVLLSDPERPLQAQDRTQLAALYTCLVHKVAAAGAV
jgi:hypothetical protein